MPSIPLYVAGKDFKVKDDAKVPYCCGIGDVRHVFADLQRQLNRFAQRAGCEPLKLDGIIGERTLDVAKKVASSIQPGPSSRFLGAIASHSTTETLAAQAARVADELSATADVFESAQPTV